MIAVNIGPLGQIFVVNAKYSGIMIRCYNPQEPCNHEVVQPRPEYRNLRGCLRR